MQRRGFIKSAIGLGLLMHPFVKRMFVQSFTHQPGKKSQS